MTLGGNQRCELHLPSLALLSLLSLIHHDLQTTSSLNLGPSLYLLHYELLHLQTSPIPSSRTSARNPPAMRSFDVGSNVSSLPRFPRTVVPSPLPGHHHCRIGRTPKAASPKGELKILTKRMRRANLPPPFPPSPERASSTSSLSLPRPHLHLILHLSLRPGGRFCTPIPLPHSSLLEE